MKICYLLYLKCVMTRKNKYASLYTRRKDGRYQGTYYDSQGVRRFVYDKDPERLYLKLEEKKSSIGEPEIVLTFEDMADSWEREHRLEITDRTWANYAPHVSDMKNKYGNRPIDDMEAADVSNDLARAKAKGYSATVVNTRRSIFQMIFDHAIIKGAIKYNPAKAVKLPKGLKRGKRAAPTREQMKAIFNNVDAPFGLFPFLLLCTGLRKSEALALDWQDIDLKNKEISITKSLDYTIGSKPKVKSPKTEAGVRVVPIIDILLPYLHGGEGPVFPCPPSTRGGKGGGLMTERAYEGAWLRYCKAAGLMDGSKPSITAHNLRHGTATLLFENGVDELTTQKILGHSRIEITREIYTDLRNEQKIKSVSKFNRGMSKLMSNSKNH